MKNIADRVAGIAESKSIKLAAVVSELRSQGKKIIGLNVGEPDFDTPAPIIDATRTALKEGRTRYSLVEGIQELRTAIAARHNNLHPRKINAKNVLISNGSKQILYNIFQTLINPGEEVIIPIPYWVTFPESVKLAGGIPVYVNTKKSQLDLVAIEAAITPKTKVIIINSPNNPSGAVYPESDLRSLAQLAKKHDLYVISDEAYEAVLFDNLNPIHMGSFDEDTFERTISVQSFSKSYCMTGFRLGYMLASEKIISAVNKLQGHLTGNNCTFAQYGALEALNMSQSIIDDMVQLMQKRRDLAYSLFSQIFPKMERPQGAFYLWPDVREMIEGKFSDDIAFAEFILREAGVAILPGSAFGAPGYLRICFAPSENEIREGFEKIKSIL